MEMAKPKGLFLRDNVWWVRKDVPKKLRPIIGKTSCWVSLNTGDLREAIVRFHPVMAQIEKEFDDARRKLRGELPAVEADNPFGVTLDCPSSDKLLRIWSL